MGDAKGVLVKFPADVLASLDAEAKRRGVTRTAVILERCAREGGADAPAVPPTAPRDPGRAVPRHASGPASVTVQAPPRAILAKAEASAAHLGVGAKAMEAAGVPFGNTRGAYQKGGQARPGAPPARR